MAIFVYMATQQSEVRNTFSTLRVCICGYRENFTKIQNSYQKCKLTLTQTSDLCLFCLRGHSDYPSLLCLHLSPHSETLALLTLGHRVLDWTDQRPWSSSTAISGPGSSRRFTRHISLSILARRPPRQRKIFQTIWRWPKMLKIKSFLWPPIHEHTRDPHTYIHTYIHTHECTSLCHTSTIRKNRKGHRIRLPIPQ